MATPADRVEIASPRRLQQLQLLEQKVLWLAIWMIHYANTVRPKRDGLKVGGHQASSASVVTLMTALYLDALRVGDRVAVKPHASPVFHALQYLLGLESCEPLERFRALGGAQAYPSRTKDHGVDFSTGSVGLGVAMTSFAALVQDYVRCRGFVSDERPAGRMIALVGDAELDEGNVFEALLEGWKHGVRNVWWIIDYNRQSLDVIGKDGFSDRIRTICGDMGWRVEMLKYGTLLQQAFRRTGGDALQHWIDSCANSRYSFLIYQGGRAWREHLKRDLNGIRGIRELLDEHDDDNLHRLMSNLGGHDMASVLTAFKTVPEGQPTCFIAYTVKGYGLPFAGHKDNHAGIMTSEQVAQLRMKMGIAEGEEWKRFSGLKAHEEELAELLTEARLRSRPPTTRQLPMIAVPERFQPPTSAQMSTQTGFGRLLGEISRSHPDLADRIVTTTPDVTISTNLGTWVTRRGVFDRRERVTEVEEQEMNSPQKWTLSPHGQHIELGIAENSLFILLAALGLSGELFGARLLPIGTVYDPFISRGLDALNYACYQDARFLIVGTPSGITLAPEGGAHQSVLQPLIGMGQPNLAAFEPAYVDELCELVRWAFEHMQARDGDSVYLRLSTRPIAQPVRPMTDELRRQIVSGAYWLIEPQPDAEVAIICCGSVVPEALQAHREIVEDIPGAGLMIVTSPDRLHRDWLAAVRSNGDCHIRQLFSRLPSAARLVSVLDGHPATLSWIGAVAGQYLVPLGVESFGQSGDIPDLFHTYHLDAPAIVDAAAHACLARCDRQRGGMDGD